MRVTVDPRLSTGAVPLGATSASERAHAWDQLESVAAEWRAAKRLVAAACTLSLGWTSMALADAAPSDDAIARELAALRAEIAELRAQADGDRAGAIDARRAAEIRSLVQDVLADADARASLQSSGMTAGWDKGFFLANPDGNFRLNVRGYLQYRYILNHVRDPGLDSYAHGFENARTQLFFEGNVVDKTWTYRVQSNFDRSTGNLTLFDAWIAKSFDNGLSVYAGQFRDPMLREFLVVETVQVPVERSLVNQAFSFDRTQGVMLDFRNDLLHVQASFNDGAKTPNTPWQAPTTEYALTGRAEVRLGGDWAQFNDLTSFPGDPLAALLGASIGWQRGESGAPVDQSEIVQWTVDASVEFGGANLFGYVVGRHVTNAPSGDLDQLGVVGQGGFFVAPTIELFGRYEWGDADNGTSNLSIATAGANWYISKQRLKVTGDFGYGFDAVSSFFGAPSSIAGWRTDTAGDNGQWVMRVQVQVMF